MSIWSLRDLIGAIIFKVVIEMKQLHRKDLFAWSKFDEERNVDFNSVLWVRAGGNIMIDPMPLSPHDEAHLKSLGGAEWIVITNSDHVRDSQAISKKTHAKIAAPAGEWDSIPFACDRWLSDGDEIVPGLIAFEMQGSKTRGELVLVLERTTLITGDLIRAHRAGSLMLLPDSKIVDRSQVHASLDRLLTFKEIETVLVGDGWSIFRDGAAQLKELTAMLATTTTGNSLSSVPRTSC